MITPPYPDSFLASHPRYAGPHKSEELVPGTSYAVLAVSAVSIIIPQAGKMSAYGSITESIVVIPPEGADPQAPKPEPEVTVSGEKPMGGVELTYDELVGLPGAPAFLSSLNELILEKYQDANPT